MRREGHFFPEQHEHEKIILFTRRHWIVFFGHIFTSVLIGGIIMAVLYAAYYYVPYFAEDPDGIKILVTIGAIVTLMIWLVIYIGWIDYYLDVWIVSNERIVEIKQNALFNRQISELELQHIEDVSAKIIGFWGTLLGFGTIFVQTAATTEMFEFLRIPRPYEVQKVILALKSKMEEHTKVELADIFDGKTRNIRQIKPLLEYVERKKDSPPRD